MLNAAFAFVPAGERIVVIEDARELQLQQEHVVGLETRPADSRGKGTITIRDLFKATLRPRPDRIVLGEIRGGEALDLIQAMTSGHGGCLTTVHASYPIDTLNRLETLALMGGGRAPARRCARSSLPRSTSSSRPPVSATAGAGSRTSPKSRCRPDSRLPLEGSLRAIPRRLADGSTKLELEPTGVIPDCLPLLKASGLDLPAAVHHAAKRARGG